MSAREMAYEASELASFIEQYPDLFRRGF